MRLAGILIGFAASVFVSGPASAQVDANCSARSVPPNAPITEPFFLFFDWDSVAITPLTRAILDNVVNLLRAIPACPVMISAHADRSGPSGYNMALSRRRAEVLRTYLRRHGIHAKIDLAAYGETRPLVETPDGVREPQNRHAEILVWTNP